MRLRVSSTFSVGIKYAVKNSRDVCNRKQLDKTIGFPQKVRSSVKKRWQGYDQWKNEHVIWLEYRIKVHPGTQPPPKPPQNLHDLHGSRASKPADRKSTRL